MFGWEIGRWVVIGAAIAVVGAFIFGVVEYRRLASRLKRLEEGKPLPPSRAEVLPPRPVARTRPPVSEQPGTLSLRTCADGAAPDDLLSYGLNSSCYTPVTDGREPRFHLVVVVTRIRNNGPQGVILRKPHLSFDLGAGARKFEPVAPLTLLSRLSFVGGDGDRPALDRTREVLLDRLFGDRSLNRTVLLVKPWEAVITYAAFLPRDLASLPVFDEDILRFGVALTAGDYPAVFSNFHACRAPHLSAVLV